MNKKSDSAQTMVSAADLVWLRRALALAARGRGTCQPNPMVGAVIVRKGHKLGEGYHQVAGGPHAEIQALRDVEKAGESPAGAELFVTLEPCSTTGRTPPCTDAILKAGLRRVVIGCLDDNPRHAGRAVQILREAGLTVAVAPMSFQQQCHRLNEAFFWWIKTGKPFVTLKMAMTLDGKIAMPDGTSKWITGPQARHQVQLLRQGAGAIMVGGRTAELDNPGLKVEPPLTVRQQPRICLWTSRNLPDNLRVSQSAPVTGKPVSQEEWLEFLASLGRDNINSLLLEGGGELAAAALAAGIVNKVCFFVAPKLMLGRQSVPVTGGTAVPELSQALKVSEMKVRKYGNDFLFTGYCENVYRID